jgi:hypothetical protein
MTIRFHQLIPFVLALATAVIAPRAALAGETMTFNAFSVWKASAQAFQTHAEAGTVIGVLRGPLYVETKEGPTRTGSIACPITIELSLENARQEARGRCTITTGDNALAFGYFECSGFHLVGCSGEFKLEGGTGRLRGVMGGGPMTLRGDEWAMKSGNTGEYDQVATGIAFWRDFSITIP